MSITNIIKEEISTLFSEESIESVASFYEHIEQLQAKQEELKTGVTVNNTSRMIIHDERYIYLWLRAKGIMCYMDYSDDLYNFLGNNTKASFCVNNHDRVEIELLQYRRAGQTYSSSLSRFCYFYYALSMTAECLSSRFKELSRASDDKDVDHVNNDKYINTSWNLALLSRYENRSKRDNMSKIKPPYFMFPFVMDDGTYIVRYGYHAPIENVLFSSIKTVICRNNTELCDLASRFYNNMELPNAVKGYGEPKLRYARDKQGGYFAGDFDIATTVYDEVTDMDRDSIEKWSGGI